MKMVDEGKMLSNGQGQVSSGLNNNPIKAKEKVRAHLSWTSLRVFCYAAIYNCDLTYHLISLTIISLIRIKSLSWKWWMRGRCCPMVRLRAAMDWTTIPSRRRRRYVSIFLGHCWECSAAIIPFIESVLLPSSFFLHCGLTFDLISFAIISLIRI